MAENSNANTYGQIGWVDLTVDDAEGIRSFYEQVTGWQSSPVDMNGYADFLMKAGEEVVAGICHARGENESMPASWLVYVTVEDLQRSLAACEREGGKIVVPARNAGKGQCAVIRDPAGAMVALYQSMDDKPGS